jgi:nucleoid DNA-binding protein
MRKPDIAKQLARRSRVTQAEAADRLDLVVRQILRDLRHGKETALPGLGRFIYGSDGRVSFEREARKRND